MYSLVSGSETYFGPRNRPRRVAKELKEMKEVVKTEAEEEVKAERHSKSDATAEREKRH